MAAYLANQIIMGKLDYTAVISKYPQYREDIDTILIGQGKQIIIINSLIIRIENGILTYTQAIADYPYLKTDIDEKLIADNKGDLIVPII